MTAASDGSVKATKDKDLFFITYSREHGKEPELWLQDTPEKK
ncbi:MAG: hypothetical protein ACW98X_24870 [Promethearchaeota archaeon]